MILIFIHPIHILTHTFMRINIYTHTLICIHTHTHTYIHAHMHNTASILAKIQEAGFQIAMQKQLTLTKEQAAEFYKEHTGKDYFDSLCTHMSRYTIG